LFQQIQDAPALAVAGAGGQPYGDAMIVNIAYTIMFNTCLFPDACSAWQVRSAAQKTWTNFNIHLAAAHREFSLTNKTAHQSGSHSANMMMEHHPYQGAADSTAQLALATASYHAMVVNLTAINAKLTLKLETGNISRIHPEDQGRHCAIEAQDQTRLARSTTS
jgi:hypothetical protein